MSGREFCTLGNDFVILGGVSDATRTGFHKVENDG